MQGAYRSSQKAELHKNAAVKYGILRRRLIWVLKGKRRVFTDKEMNEFLAEWGETDKESLPIPRGIMEKVSRKTAKEIQEISTDTHTGTT